MIPPLNIKTFCINTTIMTFQNVNKNIICYIYSIVFFLFKRFISIVIERNVDNIKIESS